MTYQSFQRKPGERRGFTIVEILVVIVIIAILAGLLAVALGPVLRRTNTFAIQQEMTQLEGAIDKFRTDYGFFPPSFKGIMTNQSTGQTLDMSNNTDREIAVNNLLPYINRISPNHSELEVIPGTSATYFEVWFKEVGQNIDWSSGEDLVFWLSGINKNKQYPLTAGFYDTNANAGGYTAFNTRYIDVSGSGSPPLVERDVRFDFSSDRLRLGMNNRSAGYMQAAGENRPYLYLDAASYSPRNMAVVGSNGITDPAATDGAYVNPVVDGADVTIDEIVRASPIAADWPSNWSAGQARTLFEKLYPNATSFQLISFGIDGEAKTVVDANAPQNPNKWTEVGPDGTDNVVNFAGEGPNTLETMLLGSN